MRNTPLTVSDNAASNGQTGVLTSYSVGALVPVTVQSLDTTIKRTTIWNETGTLYIALGPAASDTNYSYRLTANTFQEIVGYSGQITVIKASGTTAVRVTQII